MGDHHCRYPRWHRTLILFGTLGFLHGTMALLPWDPPILIGILVSTWLTKHLLQWQCQGISQPRHGQATSGALLMVGSALLLGRSEHD